MNPFTLISTKKVYENPWVRLDEDRVEKDGKKGIFGVVTMKSGVAVLLIDEEGQVILSKEYKYALKRYDINLPG